MPTEQLTDEIGRSISNLRALAKITAAGAELYACANTLERARLRITELESVGAQLSRLWLSCPGRGSHVYKSQMIDYLEASCNS